MAPCVKLMMRSTEKMSVYPRAKMAYTLPIARPFRTCWRKSLPFTPRRSRGLLHEHEGALGPVRVHLDLRHVRLLLHDLAAHARPRRERDLAERSVVGPRDELLVQLDAQGGQVHLGQRRLLVQ